MTNLLANAPVSASTKRLVRAFCTLAYSTKSKINFLATFIRIRFECLSGNTFGVAPPSWVPNFCVVPYLRIDLADTGRSKDVVATGYNIGTVLRGCSKSSRYRDISTNVAHDTVNGWVEAKCFPNNRVHDGQLTKFLVGHTPECTIRIAKVFNLLLVECLPAQGDKWKALEYARVYILYFYVFCEMKESPRASS